MMFLFCITHPLNGEIFSNPGVADMLQLLPLLDILTLELEVETILGHKQRKIWVLLLFFVTRLVLGKVFGMESSLLQILQPRW